MKSIYIERFGDNSVLQIGQRPRPRVKRGQVLVKVKAASVNPRDWIVREGKYVFQKALPAFPVILGSDISGEVVAVGAGASKFTIGQSVFGMQPLRGGMGAFAEYVAIDQSALALKPDNVSHIDAAAVPCAGLTAWQGISKISNVSSDQRVTICGASGGVGSYALQLAKARGAHVTAVCGPKHVEVIQNLGADQVINYKETHYTKVVSHQDLVFDAVGRDNFRRAKKSLNSKGRYLTTIPSAASALNTVTSNTKRMLSLGHGKSSHLVLVRPLGNALMEIANLMEQGKVKSLIDSVFPIEDTASALAKSRSWHASGKIVLDVSQ